MEQAIKKAIEGGWKYEDMISTYYAPLPLSRSFWQALGKNLGQGDFKTETKGSWKHNWHMFIDHLAEGKDADSFFKELLK